MQQDQLGNITPTVNNNDNTAKNANIFKITTAILSVVAICAIAFGIYGAVQIGQKDGQIADLKAQIDSPNDQTPDEPGAENDDNSNPAEKGLYMLGDLHTKRRYYLATPNAEPGQDTREKEMYIIDSTKLGSKDGVKLYDLSTILDQALSNKIANLPDVLADGTVNATPKSSCESYKVEAGDPTSLPGNFDWTIAADWSNLLPLTIYTSCMKADNGGELSLGTGLYALDPNTNELTQLVETIY